MPLIWKIQRQPNGTLDDIEILCEDPKVDEKEWHDEINGLIVSILAAAHAKRQTTFFKRNAFNYIGVLLDGEYWFPGFRVAPSDPKDSNPLMFLTERTIMIDMEVEAIDDMHATALADERARTIAPMLSFLLNHALYRPNAEHRWIIQISPPPFKPIRGQLTICPPSPHLTQLPKKGEICPLGEFSGDLLRSFRVAGEPLRFPTHSRRIISALDQAPVGISEAFNKCVRMFNVALYMATQFPSVSMAYLVGSIEALVSINVKELGGYSAFMKKHVGEKKGLGEFLDYIYGEVRSGHLHGGLFPMGEYDLHGFFDPIMEPDDMTRSYLIGSSFEFTRTAIVNWLKSILPPETFVEPPRV